MTRMQYPDRVEYACDGCGLSYPAENGQRPSYFADLLSNPALGLDLCPKCDHVRNRLPEDQVRRMGMTEEAEAEQANLPIVHAAVVNQDGSVQMVPASAPASGVSAPVPTEHQAELHRMQGISDVAQITPPEKMAEAQALLSGQQPVVNQPMQPSPTPQTVQNIPEGVSIGVDQGSNQ